MLWASSKKVALVDLDSSRVSSARSSKSRQAWPHQVRQGSFELRESVHFVVEFLNRHHVRDRGSTCNLELPFLVAISSPCSHIEPDSRESDFISAHFLTISWDQVEDTTLWSPFPSSGIFSHRASFWRLPISYSLGSPTSFLPLSTIFSSILFLVWPLRPHRLTHALAASLFDLASCEKRLSIYLSSLLWLRKRDQEFHNDSKLI